MKKNTSKPESTPHYHLETYMNVEIVSAAEMNKHEYESVFSKSVSGVKKPNQDEKGYLVVQEDGNKTWYHKEMFENLFDKSYDMEFSQALVLLNLGHRLCRKGWNGKDMFIYKVSGRELNKHLFREDSELKKHLSKATTPSKDSSSSDMITINSHIDMKSADGSITIGWAPSQADLFAQDWMVVRD